MEKEMEMEKEISSKKKILKEFGMSNKSLKSFFDGKNFSSLRELDVACDSLLKRYMSSDRFNYLAEKASM